MSNTRYAKPGTEQRDERFASDPLLTRGIKTGDVVRRLEILEDPQLIELALFLQYVSNLPGGLEQLAIDLLSSFPSRIGTNEMHQLGVKVAGQYSADQVREVRLGAPFESSEFLLKGEMPDRFYASDDRRSAAEVTRDNEKIAKQPLSYSVSSFVEICRSHFIKNAPEVFRAFCINPAFMPEGLVIESFDDVRGALFDYMELWEVKRLGNLPVTAVGAKVLEAVNYAEDQRCLALVEGFARIGKTFIAKAWCEARPGKRRFVSLSEATSDKEFYREIAKAVGSASSFGFKGNELRERVNDILRSGCFTLVIDEAHFLWPQRNLREATPKRVEWVRASLENYGVPVVMIATHQFSTAQKRVEKNTDWESSQLDGRIAFCAKLPDRLNSNDIEAIARFHLPDAEDRTISFLVDYVIASKKHLASIDHGVKAARHEARKAGRSTTTHKDVLIGFSNTVLPSDAALASAGPSSPAAPSESQRTAIASTLQTPCETISKPHLERDKGESLTIMSERPSRRSVTASLSTV